MDQWRICFENWIYVYGEYINISVYNPVSGSTYTELPDEQKIKKKWVINIKNNDNIGFLWCHIRHLNPLNKNPQRITKVGRKMTLITLIII